MFMMFQQMMFAEQILALEDDVYDVQMGETKPLAFGLKFI
jgi:hypothetical protein